MGGSSNFTVLSAVPPFPLPSPLTRPHSPLVQVFSKRSFLLILAQTSCVPRDRHRKLIHNKRAILPEDTHA